MVKNSAATSRISASRSRRIEVHGVLWRACFSIQRVTLTQCSTGAKSKHLRKQTFRACRCTSTPRSGGRCRAHHRAPTSAGFSVVVDGPDQTRHSAGIQHNCKHDDRRPEDVNACETRTPTGEIGLMSARKIHSGCRGSYACVCRCQLRADKFCVARTVSFPGGRLVMWKSNPWLPP